MSERASRASTRDSSWSMASRVGWNGGVDRFLSLWRPVTGWPTRVAPRHASCRSFSSKGRGDGHAACRSALGVRSLPSVARPITLALSAPRRGGTRSNNRLRICRSAVRIGRGAPLLIRGVRRALAGQRDTPMAARVASGVARGAGGHGHSRVGHHFTHRSGQGWMTMRLAALAGYRWSPSRNLGPEDGSLEACDQGSR